MPEPISTIILAKSIELLLKEGWDFFKKHAANFGDNEIIALNIGSASFTEHSADKEAITRAVNEAASKMKVDPTPVLNGLNVHLNNLFIRKGALYEILGTVTGVQQVDIKTQIAIIDREIPEIQAHIWKELKNTGQFGLESKAH